MNTIDNAFIAAIGNNDVQSYKAHMRLPNGDIGITAEYTYETLLGVIKEAETKGHTLVKIVKQ